MLKFYENLINNYVKFKQELNLRTSILSIQAWFESLKLDDVQKTPEFIRKNPEPFLHKALVYFSDLAKLQAYISLDAENKGRLSQIISKSNLFKRDEEVEVIDGVEDVHAEMRLLEKHLTTHEDTEDYYGITMLCCALCTHTVENLHVNGERVTHTRGSHGTLYPKWKLIDSIKKEPYLKQFLGDELYVMYQNLLNKKVYPPGVKNIPINLHNKSDIALLLIPAMGFINDPETFKNLGIDPNYFLPGLKGDLLYPLETQSTIFSFSAQEAIDVISASLSSLNREYRQQNFRLKPLFSKEVEFENNYIDLVIKSDSDGALNSTQNSTIDKLLAAIGKENNDSRQLGEILITRGEVSDAISDENNYYTGDFINLLLYPLTAKSLIKVYPATITEKIDDYFQKIVSQAEDYAFIPLNVTYDGNSQLGNHWVALIIDKKHQRIFYLDPAKKNVISNQISDLEKKLGWQNAIILNPIDFQQKEKQEGWIRHCGAYVIEIFNTVGKCIQEGKYISGSDLPNSGIDKDSFSLETILSSIPCGAAEMVSEIRKKHIHDACEILDIDLKASVEAQADELRASEALETYSASSDIFSLLNSERTIVLAGGPENNADELLTLSMVKRPGS